MKSGARIVTLGIYLTLVAALAQAQPPRATKLPVYDKQAIIASALKDLYQKADGRLLWYCASCEDKRAALLDYISHSDTLGLQPAQYRASGQYRKAQGADSAGLQKRDAELSKVALRFAADLYAGADLDHLLSYDEISPQYADTDRAFLVQSISGVSGAPDLVDMLNNLQPATRRYAVLKSELNGLPPPEKWKRSALLTTMNYYRWIHHFPLDSYIVVNIPAASLRMYKGGHIALQMRTVVGTPDSRTPRFASHINEISLYPYWNMPRSIMDNEWFDLIKDNRAYLDYHELEIIDSHDSVVPYEHIRWKGMNTKNFPFRIRQKTGCANPLGVVKFGMNNPFDVYLHDSPGKGAFGGQNRYYSHGCVRVENAVALADAILPGRVDERYLSACFSNQQPQVLPVPNAVPVFIVYMVAEPDGSGKVIYHQDVYKLLEK